MSPRKDSKSLTDNQSNGPAILLPFKRLRVRVGGIACRLGGMKEGSDHRQSQGVSIVGSATIILGAR